MYRFVAFFVAICALTPCAAQPFSDLSWEYRDGAVRLRVGQRSILLLRRASSGCTEVQRAHFSLHEIPEDAILAGSGLRDGAGDEFYVTTEGASLIVFHRTVRRTDPIPPYRELKRIRLLPPSI